MSTISGSNKMVKLFVSSEASSALAIINEEKIKMTKLNLRLEGKLEILYDDSPTCIVFKRDDRGGFFSFYLYFIASGDFFVLDEV